jgi:hypothetical protein
MVLLRQDDNFITNNRAVLRTFKGSNICHERIVTFLIFFLCLQVITWRWPLVKAETCCDRKTRNKSRFTSCCKRGFYLVIWFSMKDHLLYNFQYMWKVGDKTVIKAYRQSIDKAPTFLRFKHRASSNSRWALPINCCICIAKWSNYLLK